MARSQARFLARQDVCDIAASVEDGSITAICGRAGTRRWPADQGCLAGSSLPPRARGAVCGSGQSRRSSDSSDPFSNPGDLIVLKAAERWEEEEGDYRDDITAVVISFPWIPGA